MKVGFLTNTYAPYKEPLLSSLAAKVDLKVYYCALREDDRKWDVGFSGNYEYSILPGFSPRIFGYNFHVNYNLRKNFKNDKIDLLIIGGWSNPTMIYALYVALMLNIRCILWSGSTLNKKRNFESVLKHLKKFFISKFCGYIAYSEQAATYLASLGAPRDRIAVAPITVDVNYFASIKTQVLAENRQDQVRQQFGLPLATNILLFAGRLIPCKNLERLIMALGQIRDHDFKFALVGSGPLRESLENLAIEHQIANKLIWIGELDQNNLALVYSVSNIFILVSTAELSGNVINEAMATGLSVVASEIIGNDILKHDQTCLIIDPYSQEQISEAVLKLLNDNNFARQLGEKAAKIALGQFTIEHEAQAFVKKIIELSK